MTHTATGHVFHDVRFPLSVTLGARGGPSRRTDIVPLASGAEHRNRPHLHSRRRYDAGVGLKSLADVHTLLAFWEARAGEWASFRFRDPLDHRAEREVLGVGDGERTRFALRKAYGDTAATYHRPIRFAAVDGVEPPLPFTVEAGAIVFDAPVPEGVEVRATFTFDTVVRFAAPELSVSLEDFGAGRVASVPLIEVLAHEIES